MTETRAKCLLCSSTSIRPLPAASAGHRRLGRCRDCGFTFATEYDTARLEELYKAEYYSSADDPRIAAWVDGNKDVWLGLAKDLLRAKPSLRSLLDIGAGTGGFLGAVMAARPQAEFRAVESSPFASASLARRFPGIDVASSLAQDSQDDYDAIALLLTLEHLPFPEQTLREIHARLASDGVLLLTVPNRHSYRCFLQGLAEPICYGNETHLQFFCDSDLRILLAKTGFSKVVRVAGFGFGGFGIARSSIQFALRLLGISSELRYLAFK